MTDPEAPAALEEVGKRSGIGREEVGNRSGRGREEVGKRSAVPGLSSSFGEQ